MSDPQAVPVTARMKAACRAWVERDANGEFTPGDLAGVFWPDSPAHRHVSNVGHGAASGVGIKRAAGSFLHRMEKAGLVTRRWQNAYFLWKLTATGRAYGGFGHSEPVDEFEAFGPVF